MPMVQDSVRRMILSQLIAKMVMKRTLLPSTFILMGLGRAWALMHLLQQCRFNLLILEEDGAWELWPRGIFVRMTNTKSRNSDLVHKHKHKRLAEYKGHWLISNK